MSDCGYNLKPCCLCRVPGFGHCLAGNGDDLFIPAKDEQLRSRLASGEWKGRHTLIAAEIERRREQTENFLTE